MKRFFSRALASPPRLACGLASSLLLAATLPVQAASDAERLQALEQQLKNSLAAIEQLQTRLQQLEKGAGPAAESAPKAATVPATTDQAGMCATERRIENVERTLTDLTASMAQTKPADTGVPLHGFLDVNWESRGKKRTAGERNGYKLGVLDFYMAPKFGDNVRALIELAFEYGEGGGLATDAERVQIGYAFNDALVLWGGRYHTPYGYWNTAFHHGAQIQTSVTRPRFLGFEDAGGILPAHSVGAWATGKLPSAWGKVGYDVWVSNGNRISDGVLDFNASGDDNSSPGVGFNLSLNPRAVPGLTMGIHGMRQTVAGESQGASREGKGRMNFLGGYGFYESDAFELIGEYYAFRNRDLQSGSARTLSSWAGYAQVGYNLAPRWVGFVRAEKSSLNAADPYFNLQDSGSSYRTLAAGVRYDLDPRASLKLQLDRSTEASSLSANWLRAQLAIRF